MDDFNNFNDKNNKWYYKTWFIALMLVFVFPVGLYLMWKSDRLNKPAKAIMTIVVLAAAFSILGSDTQPYSSDKLAEEVNEDKKELEKPEKKEEVEKEEVEKEEAEKEEAEKEEAEKEEAEKEKAEKEEAEKEKAEKEKLEKEKAEKEKTLTKEDFNASKITYKDLARNPENYHFEKVSYTGKVIQVMENDEEFQVRMAINNNYDEVILVAIPRKQVGQRILEDDNLRIYGFFIDMHTYETVLGSENTIPLIVSEYVDFK